VRGVYHPSMTRKDHVGHVLRQWRREAPELDRSPFGVIGRISRLAQLLRPQLEPVFASHGLSAGEFDVLAALRRVGRPYRLTPTALSTALIVTSGGTTKRLNALERRGLIRRVSDPHDGRSTLVSLTSEGRRIFEAALLDHVANERSLVAGLSTRELANLARLLETLALLLGDVAGDPPRGPTVPQRRRGAGGPSREAPVR
jgi:DNA-binding MarR family transcriptional regulator